MDMVAQQKLDALKNVVANTPLAKINLKYKGKETCVYAKLEYFNFSGSIKDRMAYYILRNAYEKGEIKVCKIPILDAFARVLDCNPAWLMGYDVPMELSQTQKNHDAFKRITDRLRKDNNFFDIVYKMQMDKDFYSTITTLCNLEPDQISSINNMLLSLKKHSED